MSHLTPEEIQKAHNEGQQWAAEDKGLGFIAGFAHEIQRGPSGSVIFCSDEQYREKMEAFEKGVENVRNQD